jgi:hypothetical protein
MLTSNMSTSYNAFNPKYRGDDSLADEEEVMTVEEVRKYLGGESGPVARSVVLRLRDEGKLVPLPSPAALERPRRLLFKRADVERFAREAEIRRNRRHTTDGA